MRWWAKWTSTARLLTDRYQDSLPSADPDISFTVDVHLTVQTVRRASADPRAEAAVQLEPIMRQAVLSKTVLHRHAAQRNLNALLAQRLPLQLDHYSVIRAIATLSVDETATEAAEQIQQARREAHLDELARRQTRATMQFLREECFTDPASARLFLMLHNSPRLGSFPRPDQVEDIMEEVITWRPDKAWVQLAGLLQDVIHTLTSTQVDEILMLLEAALGASGHSDIAHQLQGLRAKPSPRPRIVGG